MAGLPATIHASAVLAGARAVLIRGPAGAGKSRLALALIEAAQSGLLPFARLVADDRVELQARHGRLRGSTGLDPYVLFRDAVQSLFRSTREMRSGVLVTSLDCKLDALTLPAKKSGIHRKNSAGRHIAEMPETVAPCFSICRDGHMNDLVVGRKLDRQPQYRSSLIRSSAYKHQPAGKEEYRDQH